ncbi:hypothetical protein CYMTET_15969 [Cymbomonas tetramitiformis]|uniref:Uncharacterized protein n=1 Tax=Cymbomonas tetramitiformis TaxID=36881 RepID=A0AAE0GEG3_9CHLO|nr:hypothetical protein CYMTET_45019 [Cymbomonas tetramitiformis]KAK3275931.1 hypothetical protein CYMTET_15969 [Cymbomonas tetramitiformis]
MFYASALLDQAVRVPAGSFNSEWNKVSNTAPQRTARTASAVLPTPTEDSLDGDIDSSDEEVEEDDYDEGEEPETATELGSESEEEHELEGFDSRYKFTWAKEADEVVEDQRAKDGMPTDTWSARSKGNARYGELFLTGKRKLSTGLFLAWLGVDRQYRSHVPDPNAPGMLSITKKTVTQPVVVAYWRLMFHIIDGLNRQRTGTVAMHDVWRTQSWEHRDFGEMFMCILINALNWWKFADTVGKALQASFIAGKKVNPQEHFFAHLCHELFNNPFLTPQDKILQADAEEEEDFVEVTPVTQCKGQEIRGPFKTSVKCGRCHLKLVEKEHMPAFVCSPLSGRTCWFQHVQYAATQGHAHPQRPNSKQGLRKTEKYTGLSAEQAEIMQQQLPEKRKRGRPSGPAKKRRAAQSDS